MSSCSINYIEDLTDTREEKDRLTKLHLDISRELFSHRIGNKGGNQIFKFANNKLYVAGEKVYFQEAVDLARSINTRLGFGAVNMYKDTLNESRHYMSIDVRKDRSQYVEPEVLQTFYKHYFGDSSIVQMSNEFEDVIETHSQVFNTIADSIKTKVSIYLNSLKQSGDKSISNRTENELTYLLGALKNRETLGLIESISSYVITSTHNIASVKNRITVITENLKNLSDNSEVRKQQLTEISDFIRHSSYYYHLFDVLDDFHTQLKVLGVNPRPIDNYERDLLERDLKSLLVKEGFEETQILGFLNQVPDLLNTPGDIVNAYKDLYKSILPDVSLFSNSKGEELEKGLNKVLNNNLKKDGGITQQVFNILGEMKVLKSQLKNLHYETLTEIYYPSFETTFNDVGEKRTIDGSESLKDKYFLSKSEFRNLLFIGEEDISFHSKWGSAMINVKENVMNTIANYMKSMYVENSIQNNEDANDLQNFLTKNEKNAGDLEEHNKNYVHDNLTIDTVEEIDETYVPKSDEEIVSIQTFGEYRKYKARKTRNFLQQYNTIAYENNRKTFAFHLQSAVDKYSQMLTNDRYSLIDLETNSDPVLTNFWNMLYKRDKTSGDLFVDNRVAKFFSERPTNVEVKRKVQQMLYTSFYRSNLSVLNKDESLALLKDNGVINNSGELIDLNDDLNFKVKKHVLNNVSWGAFNLTSKGGYDSSTLQNAFYFDPNSLFGKFDGKIKSVLVKYTDLSLGYVELAKTDDGVILVNTSGKEIMEFARFSKEYSKPADKYNIDFGGFGSEAKTKWDWKNSTAFNRDYFEKLNNMYSTANLNFGGDIALKHKELPQQYKSKGLLEKAEGTLNTLKTGKMQSAADFIESLKVNEKQFARKNKKGELVDENNELTDEPVYETSERQYINGQKIRTISAKYIRPIPREQLETDLYKSVLGFKLSSNGYRMLKNNESQALLLQSVLEGDKPLGIDPRKVKVKNQKNKRDVLVPGGELKYKERDINSTNNILSFINDYVFNESMLDQGILGSVISSNRVASLISKYTAYAALAWNVTTMPSNLFIAMINARAVSKDNQWFDADDWNSSVKEYAANYGNFMNDFRHKGFNNQKSTLSQLIVRFNAIQGEFLSPTGIIETKGLGEKMLDNALFWTQEIVEHANQTGSMIMMMKGYKLPSGVSLWKAVEEVNKDRVDGQSIVMPEEFTTELEIEFQKRLQGANRQIHGNYSTLDKTELQRGTWTNMMMTFRKYIYDGVRSRFMENRWDQEFKDEQEGYFRTYLKSLNREFTSITKNEGLSAALMSSKGLKAIGTSLLKTSLGGWDAAFGRIVSKNNSDAKSFLYGTDITERQYAAAMRATYEIGWGVRTMLLIVLVEALMSGLDDDDELQKAMLSYIDIYAHKVQGDVGFFTSFTNVANGGFAGPTIDQFRRLFQNPFAASRSIDQTAGVFSQLIDFDAMNEQGQVEFSWGALDQYKNNIKGHKKGDYTIFPKIQKSLLSPWYQMIKLMDVDQQLSYLNLAYRSSN